MLITKSLYLAAVQDRLGYEAASLKEMHSHCPQHVPEMFRYDKTMATVSMQYLEPPHVTLRTGILAGTIYPAVGTHLAELLACCLFRSSFLAMDSATFRSKADVYTNCGMCVLTEQVCTLFIAMVCK